MSQAQAKVWDMEVEPKPPVLVLGVGNILLSDEGVGVRVVERLATHCLESQPRAG